MRVAEPRKRTSVWHGLQRPWLLLGWGWRNQICFGGQLGPPGKWCGKSHRTNPPSWGAGSAERDIGGGQDRSGSRGTGVGIGEAGGGGDVGALDTGVGVCPHLLLTKEAGSVGGCGVRRASKEANRGTCETKRHSGFKCVFIHKVRVKKLLGQRFVEDHRNLVEDGALLA